MENATHFLKRPYYFEENLKRRVFFATLVAVFIFLFLYIFQPFQLSMYPDNKFLLVLGYGVVTLVVDMLFQVFLPFAIPTWFQAEKWTTGKEIALTLSMILCIGLGNLLYSNWIGVTSLSLPNLLLFEGYTLAVAIFPISFLVLGRERKKTTQHQALSHELSQRLSKQENHIEEAPKEIAEISITASNGNIALTLHPDQINYLKSESNYVEIYFAAATKSEKTLIRNTLKAMEAQLVDKQFFRCHKSYIVNLNKIERISGNAQGLKLHLKDSDKILPVSRKNNEVLKARFKYRI